MEEIIVGDRIRFKKYEGLGIILEISHSEKFGTLYLVEPEKMELMFRWYKREELELLSRKQTYG